MDNQRHRHLSWTLYLHTCGVHLVSYPAAAATTGNAVREVESELDLGLI